MSGRTPCAEAQTLDALDLADARDAAAVVLAGIRSIKWAIESLETQMEAMNDLLDPLPPSAGHDQGVDHTLNTDKGVLVTEKGPLTVRAPGGERRGLS